MRRSGTGSFVATIFLAIAVLLSGCSSPAPTPQSSNPVSIVRFEPDPPEDVRLYLLDGRGRSVVVSSSDRIITALGVDSADVLLDSEARWLAYAEFSSSGGGKTVYAGPTGGPYEPVATGIGSFRWHEARPGLLALQQRHPGVNDGQRTIQIADFTTIPPSIGAPQVVASDGALHRFGDWGFAFDLGGTVFQSTVVDPEGEVIAQRLNGFVAPLGDDPLLLIGYVADARLLSTETGLTREIDWFAPGDTVMGSAVLGDGSVAFAMSNSFSTRRRLMIVDPSGPLLDVEIDGLLPVVASSSFGPWPITIRRNGTGGIVERWRPSEDPNDGLESYEPEEIGRIDSLDLTTARPRLLLSDSN